MLFVALETTETEIVPRRCRPSPCHIILGHSALTTRRDKLPSPLGESFVHSGIVLNGEMRMEAVGRVARTPGVGVRGLSLAPRESRGPQYRGSALSGLRLRLNRRGAASPENERADC